MKSLLVTCAAATLALAPAAGLAADAPAPAGLRAEIVTNLQDAGGKIQELAGAIPAGKYAWRPSPGVRSTGEVLMHVVSGNYMFASMAGAKAPMSMDEMGKLQKQPADPAKVQQMLKDSYALLGKTIEDTPESDLDTPVDFFGEKLSKRALFLVCMSHTHEHLGQLIAYARSNGVTPPWTAREQAAAAKKKGAKPSGI